MLRISTQQPGPGAISPIAEAREWLLRLAVESQRDMPAAAMTTLLRCFEGWCATFVGLKWSVAGAVTEQLLGPPERRVLALLELHRRYLSINIAAVDQTEVEGPSSWDQWADKFCHMVGFAEKAGGVDSGPNSTSRSSCCLRVLRESGVGPGYMAPGNDLVSEAMSVGGVSVGVVRRVMALEGRRSGDEAGKVVRPERGHQRGHPGCERGLQVVRIL